MTIGSTGKLTFQSERGTPYCFPTGGVSLSSTISPFLLSFTPSAFPFHCWDGDCLHESMWKADLGPVNGAIAGGLDECEEFGVAGVEHEAIDGFL